MQFFFAIKLLFNLVFNLIYFVWELHKVSLSILGILLIGLLFSGLHFNEKRLEITIKNGAAVAAQQQTNSLERQLEITEQILAIQPSHATALYNAVKLNQALGNDTKSLEYQARLNNYYPNFEN